MSDFHEIYEKLKKMVFFILALFALGWGFTPYPSVFAGLALGTAFGLYNFWILKRRLEKFDRAVTAGSQVRSLGTAIRFASGVAAVALAITFAEHLDLISTAAGLMIPYLLLLTERIIHQVRHH
ncbi:ATP synthase subunit I [Planococcus lenghuensis]|uniref:ATP synthase subunit n=1 Tax=Planococcus lenghuensis TaxID=2213202 RepID=A0A1Q2L2I8_9BACL|nr:ATP synthase subunit I [Planococcus lenghuensis]AQQ54277.1 ATP synthase subunit [Planococcus lenghuensis]